jgi:hypothetical protein
MITDEVLITIEAVEDTELVLIVTAAPTNLSNASSRSEP